MRLALASSVLALTSVPAHADVVELLDCLDKGAATSSEQGTIDAFIANFTMQSMVNVAPIEDIARRRAVECAGQEFATQENLQFLMVYQLTRIAMSGIETSSPEAVATVKRIDEEMDETDRQRLMDLLVSGSLAEATGKSASEQDAIELGRLYAAPPVNGQVEHAELVGGYIVARIMNLRAIDALAGEQ